MIERPDRSPKILLVLGILLSVLLHKDIFNKDLIGVHLWRQAQNEWNIRNFVRTDNNILNPRIPALNLGTYGNILRYEFPLMTWSIAQVQSLLGESIFITRVIMFLVGILCIIGIYKMIGLLFQDEWVAVYTAWAFAFTPIFYYYMINPLSDVWAMCAQIWMMVFLIKYIKDLHLRHFVLSGVLLMLAGLCKLPYFMYGIMLATISGYRFFKVDHSLKILICNGFILLLISVPVVTWYWYAMKDWGYMGVIKGVFAPGGRDHLGEYIGFVFTKWLPFHLLNMVSIGFFLVGLYILISKRIFTQATRWILIIGFASTVLYYIYEMNMIAKVHDYYMLPFLMWISIPVALGIQFFNLLKYKAWIIPFIIAMPFLAYSYVNSFWSIDRNGYKTDWFTYDKELQNAVPRDSLCIILNDNTGTVVPYKIDKQGYVFDKDDLPALWVDDMIKNRRASYLYSDSRKVDTSAAIQPFLDSLILTKGQIHIYKLVMNK